MILLRVIGVLVLLLVIWWSVLFCVQRQVLFPVPDPIRERKPPKDATVIWLKGSQGDTEAWYLPPHGVPATTPAPLLIFAHGNGTLMDEVSEDFEPPRRWGMGVLLVEYPGYARSKGRPSQDSITEAMVAAFDWAKSQSFVDGQRIIPYGRSIGGGAVCQLAKRRETAALILESTFTSTRSFASRFGAPGFLMLDPFDNLEVIKDYPHPVFLIHGTQDEVIPFDHGQKLAAAAGIKLHSHRGGHNDMPRPWELIEIFLQENKLLDGSR